jgi:hypothetical protein
MSEADMKADENEVEAEAYGVVEPVRRDRAVLVPRARF